MTVKEIEKDSLIPLKTKKKKKRRKEEKRIEIEEKGGRIASSKEPVCKVRQRETRRVPRGAVHVAEGSPGENPRKRRSQTGQW